MQSRRPLSLPSCWHRRVTPKSVEQPQSPSAHVQTESRNENPKRRPIDIAAPPDASTRLPSCLLIENVSAIGPRIRPGFSAPRHFRSRLKTSRAEPLRQLAASPLHMFIAARQRVMPSKASLTTTLSHQQHKFSDFVA